MTGAGQAQPRGILAGAVLVAIGLTFLLQALRLPFVGPLLFVALGIAFAIPYAQDRSRYVYLVPAAVLLGIGLGLLVPDLLGAQQAAGRLFLIAMTLAFAAVYLIEPSRRWPLAPALVFGVLAVLEFFGVASFIPDVARPFVVPVLLIAVGAYLLLPD